MGCAIHVGRPLSLINIISLITKHHHTMKNIIIKLKELDILLTTEVSKREETFENRSERWQESEKGEEYQEITDELELFRGSVEDMIDRLEEAQG